MTSLHAELERALRERDELDAAIRYLQKRVGDTPAVNGKRATRKGAPTAAAAAEQALREHGKPMRTPDLLAAVQALGAQVKDTDGLYKTLSRHKGTFKRAGRGLWTLA
jgi:hypothetical protein